MIEVNLYYTTTSTARFTIYVRRRMNGEFLFRVIDELRPSEVNVFIKNKIQAISYFKSIFEVYAYDLITFYKCIVKIQGYPNLCLLQMHSTNELITSIVSRIEDRLQNSIASFWR